MLNVVNLVFLRFAKTKKFSLARKRQSNDSPSYLPTTKMTNDDRLYTFRWTISYILKWSYISHLQLSISVDSGEEWANWRISAQVKMSFEADGLSPDCLNTCSHQPARWGSWAPVLPHGGTDEGALDLEDILHCFAAKGRKPPVPFPEDYRPVDLTSHIARTSKKLALRQTTWTQDNLLITVTVLTLNSGGNNHSPHMLYYTGCSAHWHQTNKSSGPNPRELPSCLLPIWEVLHKGQIWNNLHRQQLHTPT